MGGVAVGAHRNILVVFLYEGFAMDALKIAVIDLLVAPGAGLGDLSPGLVRGGHIMGPMAIDTNRRPCVSCLQDSVMHTVQGSGIVG